MKIIYSIRSKKNGIFIESTEIVVSPFTGGANINGVNFSIPNELLRNLNNIEQYDKGVKLVNGIVEFVDSFTDKIFDELRNITASHCSNYYDNDFLFKAKLDLDQLVEGLVKDGKL